jgi:hypothetical protein
VPTELIEPTQRVVVAAMEAAPASFTVPLKVEVKMGTRQGNRRFVPAAGRSEHPGGMTPHALEWCRKMAGNND